MRKPFAVAGLGIALCSAIGFAADSIRQPMDRADEALARNIARNPDNQGLRNALDHHRTNRERQATRGKNQAPGQQKAGLRGGNSAQQSSAGGADRAQGDHGQSVDRVGSLDKVEKVDRAARPDTVERVDRVVRPEVAARPERPDPPGRAKR